MTHINIILLFWLETMSSMSMAITICHLQNEATMCILSTRGIVSPITRSCRNGLDFPMTLQERQHRSRSATFHSIRFSLSLLPVTFSWDSPTKFRGTCTSCVKLAPCVLTVHYHKACKYSPSLCPGPVHDGKWTDPAISCSSTCVFRNIRSGFYVFMLTYLQ